MNPIHLSPRELEVLEGLFTGKQVKEVANDLDITYHTVKFHCNALRAKFKASTSTEVIYKALQQGILKPPSVQTQLPFSV
jgi:DNA-binding NarL/FixJ family response regulator